MNIQRRLAELDMPSLLKTDHPMVKEFRFESQSLEHSTSAHRNVWGYGEGTTFFSLDIKLKPGISYWQQRDEGGKRITPVRRVTTGEEEVGRGNRVLTIENGEIVAENSTFFPHQEFNDLGIGSSLYVAQERFYRALGVRKVRLFAASVGRYMWARQGFKFTDPNQTISLGKEFNFFLAAHGYPLATVMESWDIVNHVDTPRTSPVLDRIGKYFALRSFPSWEGFKLLDSDEHNQVAVASREETFSRLPDRIPGAPKTLITF